MEKKFKTMYSYCQTLLILPYLQNLILYNLSMFHVLRKVFLLEGSIGKPGGQLSLTIWFCCENIDRRYPKTTWTSHTNYHTLFVIKSNKDNWKIKKEKKMINVWFIKLSSTHTHTQIKMRNTWFVKLIDTDIYFFN